MKKRIIALVLFFACVLCGVAFAAGGSQNNPLVSLSYLNGTYRSNLTSLVGTAVANATKPIYDKALARLNGLTSGNPSLDGETDTTAWLSSDSFKTQGGEKEDTVTLALGASLLWTSGAATTNAPLVDATIGQELAAGAALTAGHRYLAPERVVIYIASKTAYWAVQGKWTTTSDGVSVAELAFTDVSEDDYYYDAVVWAVENGVAMGNGNLFSPERVCNRADAMTFMWRAAGCPSPSSRENPFTDVSGNDYYCDAVLWAVEKGITKGTGNGTTFSPKDPCRREQIVTFLWRAAGSPAISANSNFSDVSGSAYYASAVTWAVENGITKGNGVNTFGPTEPCRRAQIVTFLYRDSLA